VIEVNRHSTALETVVTVEGSRGRHADAWPGVLAHLDEIVALDA